jgi:hypothetical protein
MGFRTTVRRYANAVDVVVEVLRELGPLSLDQLIAEAIRPLPCNRLANHAVLVQ